HHVQLCGWPVGVKWCTPSKITIIDDIQDLRKALQSGECTWVKIEQAAYQKLLQEVKGKLKKQRQTCCDKGISCHIHDNCPKP
ncbi:hypothetical protein BDQ17DRAFT_1262687, partial [Cyathus striatus]